MTKNCISWLIAALLPATLLLSCDKKPKVNYEMGIFPEEVMNLEGLNTIYDDYNVDIDEASIISTSHTIVFSSNRHSNGGEFNLVQGSFAYTFGQTSGTFLYYTSTEMNDFLKVLTKAFNTSGNDFGPNRIFNRSNGFEYMFTATATDLNGLNIVYSKYLPIYSIYTDVPAPVPATLFNTSSDDAYICFNANLDTAYFCSDRGGNFDIYMLNRSSSTDFDTWLKSPAGSATAIDSLTTSDNEKCPSVTGKYMVFTSDAPGGYGGYDLYYSVLRNGKWSKPINFGPKINSEYNEYRPVLSFNSLFSNGFILFSSDRETSIGGYDLFFAGVPLER